MTKYWIYCTILFMLAGAWCQAEPQTQPAQTQSEESESTDTMTQTELLKDLDPGTYAVFNTTHGDFVVKLFTEKAPITTKNFMDLAMGYKEYRDPESGEKKKDHYYDGIIFHRVIDGFMLQGGDPTGTGTGGPGFTIPDEFHPSLRHDKPGMLSMANIGRPNTGGAQFFITVAPTPHLDDRHAIFGEVVKNMDRVFEISKVKTDRGDRPVKEVKMEQVRIYEVLKEGEPQPYKEAGNS